MNIVIFTEIKAKGGLDTFLVNLLNSWPNDFDNFIIYCNHDHPSIDDLKVKIIRNVIFKSYSYNKYLSFLISLPIKYNNSILIKILYRVIELPIIYSYFVFLCMKLFSRIKYDRLLIVNGGYPGSLVCRAAVPAWFFSGNKGKVIYNFHNYCYSPPCYAYYEFFIDYLVNKLSDKFISVSNSCTKSLMNRKVFKLCEKITIYNGITDFYNKKSSKSIENEGYCLILARLHPDKGHLFLINSFRLVVNNIPSAKLLIYGSGSSKYKNELISLVKVNNLTHNVKINNDVSNISPILRDSTLLLAPSLINEPFNYTIIEAMCIKKPVIVSDVGGMPEVVGKSEGGFVVPLNERLFANKIIELMSDDELLEKMGNNGRRYFEENYKASVMSKKYYKALK